MLIFRLFFLCISLLVTVTSVASTQLTATRVIIFEENKEGSITVLGDPKNEFLIQAWVDAGLEAQANKTPIPLAVSPNLAQVLPKQEQKIRILYQGSGLAADRESVFWLNVQEVPQASDKNNVLQLAVRQRLKIFYRPAALGQNPNDAIQEVQFQVNTNTQQVTIHNPTPYHISFGSAAMVGTNKKETPISIEMLAPFATQIVSLNKGISAENLVFDVINDYGNSLSYRIALQEQQSQKAIAVETP